MLAKSSEITEQPGLSTGKKVLRSLGFLLWVSAAFIGAQLIVALVMIAVAKSGAIDFKLINTSVLTAVVAGISYALALAITIGLPWLVMKHRTTLADLGMPRLPEWSDLALGPLAFIPYFIVSIVVASLAALIPGFPSNQVQDVGFSGTLAQSEMILAFLTLVVLAPLVEEIIFRGYLYTKLKRLVGSVVGALLVSLCFGALHMQLNVALDVFVMSMAACLLREMTGSVWAGVLLHMTKNFVAFYILFIRPLLH